MFPIEDDEVKIVITNKIFKYIMYLTLIESIVFTLMFVFGMIWFSVASLCVTLMFVANLICGIVIFKNSIFVKFETTLGEKQ